MSEEFWNKSFSKDTYVYGKQANTFVVEKTEQLKEAEKIACFAEGEGRNAVHLAKQGHHVTVFDQSEEGLAKAERLAEEEGVHIDAVQADLTKKDMEPGQFDAAVMVFGHVPKDHQRFLIDQMIKSVKPGGYVLFEVYSENQIAYETGGPKDKQMLYKPEEVLDWIRDYKCLHFYYGEADRTEGERHTGVGHVIQAFIRV
ncbi:class I SAM-dependent methyltransferase [Halobacillus sp. GSS1]|uniref:class I SAM-dependent methyltransferase n=1 Tax=Halobacillus sp. GSS1 TaxID=2815919 RepID=UPI001A8D994F|nr:class I SAM-dependent methyltransferase [Halobacillus sp. GSS1]